ncbi:BnaUnng03060D [Brassica napus]|nr:BnaUnng03060D [Brassica napus]VDD56754.1 unnamed protein product [Brassica oleracea]
MGELLLISFNRSLRFLKHQVRQPGLDSRRSQIPKPSFGSNHYLGVDPEKRLTVDESLSHGWFTPSTSYYLSNNG